MSTSIPSSNPLRPRAPTSSTSSKPAAPTPGKPQAPAKPQDTFAEPSQRSKPVDLSGGAPAATPAMANRSATTPAPAPAPAAEAAAPAAADAVAASQPPAPTGEQVAADAVDMRTVAERKADTQTAQQKLRESTNAQVDEVFAAGRGEQPPPEGTEVRMLADNQAELVRRSETGEIIERTLATREADGRTTLDTTTYEKGVNQRDSVELGADGSTLVRHAQWKSDTSQAGQPHSFEDLEAWRNPETTVTSNYVREEDGKYWVTEYSQVQGAVNLSDTLYLQQDGGGGIDDKLEGPFDFDQPVDQSQTFSYHVPAPNADGTQPPPEYSRILAFSQGHVQATSVVSKKLEGWEHHVSNHPHNREDMTSLSTAYHGDGGLDFDGNRENPKQWVVELKTGEDTLSTQTFIEGAPDATVMTHRTRTGNQVVETYSGKTFKPDGSGDLVDVSGDSTKVYAQDGSLEKLDAKRIEPDGSTVEQHYTSSRQATAEGLKLSEQTQMVRTTQDGQTYKSQQQTDSRLSGQGVELLSSSTTMTGPDGTQATSTVGPAGEQLTLTAPDGSAPRPITGPADLTGVDATGQDLLLQAGAGTASTVNEYLKKGGVNAAKTLQGLSAAGAALSDSAKAGRPVLATAASVFGHDAVHNTMQGLKGSVQGVGGAAGAAMGGFQLAQGIRDGNVPTILTGLAGIGVGAYDMYSGGKAFLDSLKGISDMTDEALAAAGELPGWLSKLPGVGKLASTAAAGKALGAVKGLGGIGNVAGAVIGTALGVKDIVDGIRNGDGYQIAQGAVGITGAVGGAAASIMAGSAFGGPVGVVVGAIIAGFTFGITKIIDLIADREHQIAELQID